jgi:hypothetical protein
MTTFAGFDVLEIPPNAVTSWGSTVSRTVDRCENANGNVVTTTRSDAGRDTRTLTWHCATRADLTALRALLDARLGALVPIWIPTYQRDLNVTALNFAGDLTTALGGDVAAGLANLVDTATAWHYWTAIGPGIATRFYGYFENVTDLGSGLYRYEHGSSFILDVGGPLVLGGTSAAGAIYSRLLLCRLTGGYHVDVLGAAAVVTAEFVQITAGS